MCTNNDNIFEIIKWITPVCLFFIGIYFNKLSELIKENKRLRTIERFFYSQLEFLDKQLEEEIKQLSICLEKLKDWDNIDILLEHTSNRVSERLLGLSQQDLFAIFISRKKGKITDKTKLYNQVIQTIDYISRELPHMLNANEKTHNRLNGFYDELNDALMEISKVHNSIISDKTISKNFTIEFSDILKEFNRNYKDSQHSQNIQNIHTYQVQPLMNLSKRFSTEKKAQELITPCDKANIILQHIELIRKNHTKFIDETKKKLITTKGDLSIYIKKIEETKTKQNYVA